ncbi:adenosine kinase [Parvularcula lutaonensis]|uniref:Adenosine kinase n=1 Tax=Parvularcula lutaonensis TaxID=491923 RepID=A0ABV7MER4_9PROT|nr:adenosine kinase [Parvularcula lutaonensis]GGY51663.1 adenosine kinase [Parvularcula lutaonensis]
MGEVQVAALGNAIVDVLGEVDDAFIDRYDIIRGGMALIDADRAAMLTDAFGATTHRVAGGSAGNSLACIASLGGSARFIGTVADDELGTTYRESMRSVGVKFDTPARKGDTPTGRCLIAVTPDAERSMQTFLGVAGDIRIEDLQPGDVEEAQVFFIEGYHFETEASRATCVEAANRAKDSGRFTAITLADSGMVQRHLEPLRQFISEKIDIVFANKDEAIELTGKSDPLEAAQAMRELSKWGVVTMSGDGSYVFGPEGEIEKVDAIAPEQLVDTTGAGDAYAAGWLYGFTKCMPLKECGRLGSLAASEVISHYGARPEKNLRELAEEHGFVA